MSFQAVEVFLKMDLKQMSMVLSNLAQYLERYSLYFQYSMHCLTFLIRQHYFEDNDEHFKSSGFFFGIL